LVGPSGCDIYDAPPRRLLRGPDVRARCPTVASLSARVPGRDAPPGAWQSVAGCNVELPASSRCFRRAVRAARCLVAIRRVGLAGIESTDRPAFRAACASRVRIARGTLTSSPRSSSFGAPLGALRRDHSRAPQRRAPFLLRGPNIPVRAGLFVKRTSCARVGLSSRLGSSCFVPLSRLFPPPSYLDVPYLLSSCPRIRGSLAVLSIIVLHLPILFFRRPPLLRPSSYGLRFVASVDLIRGLSPVASSVSAREVLPSTNLRQ